MATPASEEQPPQFLLDTLTGEFPHVPVACGTMLAQAAVLCLDKQGHAPGVVLSVGGSCSAVYTLHWSEEVTESMLRFWNDWDEATEQGACAVALLLVRALTGYTVIERSRKGTGFDGWLGSEDNLFQAKARLEVSGILRGPPKRVNSRLQAKLKQTMRSDAGHLPA
jgi:hypothetical protein